MCGRLIWGFDFLKIIQRAGSFILGKICQVCVNHGCGDIFMPQQTLDGANVIYMDVVYAGFAGAKTGPCHVRVNEWHNYGGKYGRLRVY